MTDKNEMKPRDLDEIIKLHTEVTDAFLKEIAKRRAENLRLRAALEKARYQVNCHEDAPTIKKCIDEALKDEGE